MSPFFISNYATSAISGSQVHSESDSHHIRLFIKWLGPLAHAFGLHRHLAGYSDYLEVVVASLARS